MVDAWCSVERGRLQWVSTHQSIISSDLYNNVIDSLRRGDFVATDDGKRVVLPSSFTGSYRYMQQNFQDSLAICNEYGHPDLFITFTCNPKWVEILDAVKSSCSQDASVRPDIVARVFKMKLDAMIVDFTKNSVLGRVLAGMRSHKFLLIVYTHLCLSGEFAHKLNQIYLNMFLFRITRYNINSVISFS